MNKLTIQCFFWAFLITLTSACTNSRISKHYHIEKKSEIDTNHTCNNPTVTSFVKEHINDYPIVLFDDNSNVLVRIGFLPYGNTQIEFLKDLKPIQSMVLKGELLKVKKYKENVYGLLRNKNSEYEYFEIRYLDSFRLKTKNISNYVADNMDLIDIAKSSDTTSFISFYSEEENKSIIQELDLYSDKAKNTLTIQHSKVLGLDFFNNELYIWEYEEGNFLLKKTNEINLLTSLSSIPTKFIMPKQSSNKVVGNDLYFLLSHDDGSIIVKYNVNTGKTSSFLFEEYILDISIIENTLYIIYLDDVRLLNDGIFLPSLDFHFNILTINDFIINSGINMSE